MPRVPDFTGKSFPIFGPPPSVWKCGDRADAMSLRARVVALIAGVLLISMAAGTLLAGYQARAALRAELMAGLGRARQTVSSAFEDLPNSDHPARAPPPPRAPFHAT